nr:unnamed protein product [Spirometra erinaceieuropaei]
MTLKKQQQPASSPPAAPYRLLERTEKRTSRVCARDYHFTLQAPITALPAPGCRWSVHFPQGTFMLSTTPPLYKMMTALSSHSEESLEFQRLSTPAVVV